MTNQIFAIFIILNLSSKSQVYPHMWKNFIIPIPKFGNEQALQIIDPYRLCVLAKVFENIMFNQLYPHVANLMLAEQLGAVEKRSFLPYKYPRSLIKPITI